MREKDRQTRMIMKVGRASNLSCSFLVSFILVSCCSYKCCLSCSLLVLVLSCVVLEGRWEMRDERSCVPTSKQHAVSWQLSGSTTTQRRVFSWQKHGLLRIAVKIVFKNKIFFIFKILFLTSSYQNNLKI
jgi:hypothetical protein